jgi:hypothetical protein
VGIRGARAFWEQLRGAGEETEMNFLARLVASFFAIYFLFCAHTFLLEEKPNAALLLMGFSSALIAICLSIEELK